MAKEFIRRTVGIFLHVATIGRYNEVFNEVLLAISKSELFQHAKTIEINVVGKGDLLPSILAGNMLVVRRSESVTEFEHLTLASIQKFSRENPDAAILYLNCLGGRYVGKGYKVRQEWRKMLYYILLDEASQCLSLLDEFDVCGADWVELPLPHMTSNNWWANANYLASLISPPECVRQVQMTDLSRFGVEWSDPDRKRRHAGEFWLGISPNVRAFSLLDLRALGLPTSQYESVPWWDFPGLNWRKVARMKFRERRRGKPDVLLAMYIWCHKAFYFSKLRLRRIKMLQKIKRALVNGT